MRIVAGSHGGRRLKPVPDGIRPTADRAREALFSILESGRLTGGKSPIPEAMVLDAFAGSGALGLEALSRGAARAVFLDADRRSLALARDNAALLGESARCQFIARDARHPGPAGAACSVAFLDPPYGKDLAPPALAALAGQGWLAPRALIVVEAGRRDPVPLSPDFSLIEERAYGAARFVILRYRAEGPLPSRSLT